ncbi:hypothetical protein ACR3K2_09380 [Cryptosporidium serpentis]
MNLHLCTDHQLILKIPTSIVDLIKNAQPGEQIGCLSTNSDGLKEWQIKNVKLTEIGTSSNDNVDDKFDINSKSSRNTSRNGYLFMNCIDESGEKMIMYPSTIYPLKRSGGIVNEDIRKKIKENALKQNSTIEDTKRIVGAVYESSSQPFLYYNHRSSTDYNSNMDDQRVNTNTTISTKKRQSSGFSINISEYNIESLKEHIFKIFEEKGSEGVSIKEIEDRTLQPKQLVKKVVEEIAFQTARGGRRHIWYLKSQYTTK